MSDNGEDQKMKANIKGNTISGEKQWQPLQDETHLSNIQCTKTRENQ